MARRLSPRKSPAEMARSVDRWMRFASPTGELPAGMEPTPPKRERAAANADLAEAGVMREIKELLTVHPDVFYAERRNSGGASYENSTGRYAPIMFYEILRAPEKDITVVDFVGILRDKRPFAIEAKSRNWRFTGTDRELRQQGFIGMILAAGGVGGFATSCEDAKRIIEG